MDEKDKLIPSSEEFLPEESPLTEEPAGPMPELVMDSFPAERDESDLSCEELPQFAAAEESLKDEVPDYLSVLSGIPEEADEATADPELDFLADITDVLGETEESAEDFSEWDAPASGEDPFFSPAEPQAESEETSASKHRGPRKGRPQRKKGSGLLGIPHLLATVVWLAIIVMIGTSLGRMLWVCAADVLAFGRDSKQVTVTITSNDTIDDIAEKLHDAQLVRYPGLFKLYASIAVDDGDILPGTFQLDTLYDYHALVVQMGPRSSTREVVYDLLIPEGLNCRQIFELLEQNNVCTVAELEEYAASGEFADFWFLEGVERGDKYCLEGFLFPDTYDFYMGSTPREALGKMLLGFEARVNQQETMTALNALNDRLSGMMRAKGCSEAHIAEHQLTLRDLLTVASLIEEETASSKESPMIASVIFNRLTEDLIYERYLNIDAAIIYATGDPNNIDTSIDHPYNTYKNPGLTPGPISNPGLESINAALHFEDTDYYYYVLNPETDMHQFSKTLEEHEKWVEKFRGTEE